MMPSNAASVAERTLVGRTTASWLVFGRVSVTVAAAVPVTVDAEASKLSNRIVEVTEPAKSIATEVRVPKAVLNFGSVMDAVKLVVCKPVVSVLVLAGVVPKDTEAACAAVLATKTAAAARAIRNGDMKGS